MRSYLFYLLIACLVLHHSQSFLVDTLPAGLVRNPTLLPPATQSNDNNEPDPTPMRWNPLAKASWYAVEAFGKVFGSSKSSEPNSTGLRTDEPPQSIQETIQRLQADNDREYFLSGTIDALIYDPDCEFADPFVSFRSRDRFVENLQNLGSFITKYSARPLTYTAVMDGPNPYVETKFMVKLELNLPWKPVLAWPWGVRCEIDRESNLIVVHRETWDIDPLQVNMLSSDLIT